MKGIDKDFDSDKEQSTAFNGLEKRDAKIKAGLQFQMKDKARHHAQAHSCSPSDKLVETNSKCTQKQKDTATGPTAAQQVAPEPRRGQHSEAAARQDTPLAAVLSAHIVTAGPARQGDRGLEADILGSRGAPAAADTRAAEAPLAPRTPAGIRTVQAAGMGTGAEQQGAPDRGTAAGAGRARLARVERPPWPRQSPQLHVSLLSPALPPPFPHAPPCPTGSASRVTAVATCRKATARACWAR